MKWKKMNTAIYLIFVMCLFTACAPLKYSNFNRKKYLDLKVEKSNSDKEYAELDKTKPMSVNSNEANVNKTSAEDSENPSPFKADFPVVQKSKSDLELDSTGAEDASLFLTTDPIQLNDTLFFKSGKVKPCAIYRWEGGFVEYYLMENGVPTKRSITKKSLTCYAVYDSINHLEFYEGECWYPVINNPYISEAENASKSESQISEISDKEMRSTFKFAIFLLVLASLMLIFVLTGEAGFLTALFVLIMIILIVGALLLIIRNVKEGRRRKQI